MDRDLFHRAIIYNHHNYRTEEEEPFLMIEVIGEIPEKLKRQLRRAGLSPKRMDFMFRDIDGPEIRADKERLYEI